jgi:hypothetical protein
MAVTTENSTQYANTVATPPVKNAPYDCGTSRVFYFTHTQAVQGDANSMVNLVKLPAGKYRILLDQSVIAHSDLGTGNTMSVGHTGYTKFDGTAVTADADAFISATDVATAAATVYFTESRAAASDDLTFLVDSTTAVVIQALIESSTMPAAGTLKGYITIVGA